ncbi:InlB B-repeat-containing protein [Halomonas denitrificans]|nr:hypothetical protein [Halomonas denitrificans]
MLAVAMLSVGSTAVRAAVIPVGEVVEVAEDGRCSLLEAFENAAFDRAVYADCPAGTGADQLWLAPGHVYLLDQPWTGADSAVRPITGELDILGNGARIERATQAPEGFRMLDVVGGRVLLDDVELSNFRSDGLMVGGGAIRVYQAEMTIRNSRLRQNLARGLFRFGGAIRMDEATVLIEDSYLIGNSASSTDPEQGGGAIAQFDGELTIRRSSLVDNSADIVCAPGRGDTLAGTGGALRIEAVGPTGARAYIYDSTLADNIARVGGGIHLVAIADTGVAGIEDVFVQLMRSTLVRNRAESCGSLTGLGDGIHVQEAFGGSGRVAFGNTILHGNGRPVGGDILGLDCSANDPNVSFYSQDGNVIDPDDQCPSFGFDAFEPDLDAIIDDDRVNGDSAHYLPLAAGPAVDLPEAGIHCEATPDQLGNPRAGGAGAGGSLCDSGAVELQPIGAVYTLTVEVIGPGSGRVVSSPAGIDCPGTCSVPLAGGTVVELTAIPDPGHTFASWFNGGCSGDQSCSLLMDSDRSTLAGFFPPQRYPLEVLIQGGSGQVLSSPDGIDCPGVCLAEFDTDSTVELTQVPAPGFVFEGWSGPCSGTGSCSVPMTQAQSVTASYGTENPLTVIVDGPGRVTSSPIGIDCPGNCSESFASGETVTLLWQADPGSAFLAWTGDCSGNGGCQLSMDQPRSVGAEFGPAGYELRVIMEGAGSGRVFDLPAAERIDCPGLCSATFDAGTVVTLQVTVDAGSSFQSFAGDCSGPSCSVSLDRDREVRAIIRSPEQVFLDSFE